MSATEFMSNVLITEELSLQGQFTLNAANVMHPLVQDFFAQKQARLIFLEDSNKLKLEYNPATSFADFNRYLQERGVNISNPHSLDMVLSVEPDFDEEAAHRVAVTQETIQRIREAINRNRGVRPPILKELLPPSNLVQEESRKILRQEKQQSSWQDTGYALLNKIKSLYKSYIHVDPDRDLSTKTTPAKLLNPVDAVFKLITSTLKYIAQPLKVAVFGRIDTKSSYEAFNITQTRSVEVPKPVSATVAEPVPDTSTQAVDLSNWVVAFNNMVPTPFALPEDAYDKTKPRRTNQNNAPQYRVQ